MIFKTAIVVLSLLIPFFVAVFSAFISNAIAVSLTLTKHIWSDYLEKVEDIRHTPIYKEMYERRKETIERVFADAKEKHAMRYTPYRGLSQVTNWVRLKFATMNLKKYAVHRWKRLNALQPSAKFSLLFNFLLYFNFKTLKLS